MPDGIFPGLNLSIIREKATGGAGQPLNISGRLTVIGLGVPAFIRVTLEGPDYEPQRVTFVALSQPVTGNYQVAVIPPKDGEYDVYAEAFALPPIPLLDILPPGPSLAESPRAPIAIGQLVETGEKVKAELPGGGTIYIPTPQLSPTEILQPIYLPAPAAPTAEIPSLADLLPALQAPTTTIITLPAPTAPEVPGAPAAPEVGGQIVSFEVQ